MAERRIGLIPNAKTIMRSADLEDCAIFVTDRRTIIAFEEPRVKGLRASFKQSFEDPDEAGAKAKEQTDFATVDIDKLASENENLSVPHTSIEKLKVRKGLGGYSLMIEYKHEDGKKRYAFVDLSPSREYLELRKAEGVQKKDAMRQYAHKAQEVFKRALPPVAAGKAEWSE